MKTTKIMGAAAAAACGATLLTAPAAQAQAEAPKQVLSAPAATSKVLGCGGWFGSDIRHRACNDLDGNLARPAGEFLNRNNHTVTFGWAVDWYVGGKWVTCKSGRGPLGPHASWRTWCGWYVRPVVPVRTRIAR
ncbi:hypothetical protein [Actinomadura litoris]|uniref:hypothetical protein n=1 Tax=Actinomadura litoris TaxID=2678616 RepID=UPI001FA788F7|nr:hypothetical protein [Actinomadura litoris]